MHFKLTCRNLTFHPIKAYNNFESGRLLNCRKKDNKECRIIVGENKINHKYQCKINSKNVTKARKDTVMYLWEVEILIEEIMIIEIV